MIEKHLMKLRARSTVSADEEALIRRLPSEKRMVPAKKTVIRAGELLSTSTLLLDGLMCRYKDLRDGQRQITELHTAGDFVDLHSFTLKRLDHNIMALTACEIAVVPHERLEQLTIVSPHLTRLYWFTTNLDAAIHREWELSLGRRSAHARTAHLICELRERLKVVGLANDHSYSLPITQLDLAECVGMTSVHVNRVLRDFREQKLVDFSRRRVDILDWPKLARLAEFSTDYLYLDPVPL
jgi:CRP-like cAMP-binding protein